VLLRQDLQKKVGDAFNSVSRLLSENEEGKGALADCPKDRAAIVGMAVLITPEIAYDLKLECDIVHFSSAHVLSIIVTFVCKYP
jgi:hypothetical protein